MERSFYFYGEHEERDGKHAPLVSTAGSLL